MLSRKLQFSVEECYNDDNDDDDDDDAPLSTKALNYYCYLVYYINHSPKRQLQSTIRTSTEQPETISAALVKEGLIRVMFISILKRTE